VSDLPIIKTVAIDKLIPYARNSRTHSEEQVSQIAASIKEFGFLNPIIIDGDNGIIAGHGRVMAAKKLGMTELPCVDAKHLSDAQRRAYVIADNKLALNAEWDYEMLKIELGDLEALDFDLSVIGFDDEETMKILGDGMEEVKAPTEDEYKEVYEVVVSCRDESEQEAIFQMMTAKGLKCRVLSM
jgi:ParB-like chromosome segregation protein Spo0J